MERLSNEYLFLDDEDCFDAYHPAFSAVLDAAQASKLHSYLDEVLLSNEAQDLISRYPPDNENPLHMAPKHRQRSPLAPPSN